MRRVVVLGLGEGYRGSDSFKDFSITCVQGLEGPTRRPDLLLTESIPVLFPVPVLLVEGGSGVRKGSVVVVFR